MVSVIMSASLLRVRVGGAVNAPHMNSLLALAGLREVVSHLQAQPRFRAASKSLVEPNCHISRDSALAVDQIVKGLPGHTQDFRRCGGGQTERLDALVTHR